MCSGSNSLGFVPSIVSAKPVRPYQMMVRTWLYATPGTRYLIAQCFHLPLLNCLWFSVFWISLWSFCVWVCPSCFSSFFSFSASVVAWSVRFAFCSLACVVTDGPCALSVSSSSSFLFSSDSVCNDNQSKSIQKTCICSCAHQALVVRKRRYKRPSVFSFKLYCKNKVLRQQLLEEQWQFFFSCDIAVMVCGLEKPFMGHSLDEFVDFLQDDCDRGPAQCCASTYEQDSVQICNDVYEYQQVQAVENSDMEDAVADVLKKDDSGLELPSDEDEVNSPEDEMLTVAQGLFYDPTADGEGDDFQDTVPTYEDTGKFGIRGKSSLVPMDVCDLLKSQRFGFELHSRQAGSGAKQIELSDVFDFVPDLVMALLMSVFTVESQLLRMLSQAWVRSWKGWEEWDKSKRNEGSVDLSDDSFAEELVRRLVAISMDQAVTNYPSDVERRQELLMLYDLDVKQGDGSGNNCLTDSLLQGLLHHKVILQPENDCRELQWRRRHCDEVRLHLCFHDDVRLRPKQRDERNAIRCVSQEEHNRAYLEHHRHAVAIVTFFGFKVCRKERGSLLRFQCYSLFKIRRRRHQP